MMDSQVNSTITLGVGYVHVLMFNHDIFDDKRLSEENIIPNIFISDSRSQ